MTLSEASLVATIERTASASRSVRRPVPCRLTGLRIGIRMLFVMLAAACAHDERPIFTATEQQAAVVPGYDDVPIRLVLDADPERLREAGAFFLPDTDTVEPEYLALSGGGAQGAVGAGVLVGWSASGKRPAFDLVTGVSAGALIAPFAFLGKETDDTLTGVFTSGVAEGLIDRRFFLFGLLGQSLADPDPLKDLVAEHVDESLLLRIAEEHGKGRRLHIVTTNLDSQRNVLWDLGAIASSGRPDALSLFREALTASASIPGIFPGVEIETVADGRTIRELHADGSIVRQVFVFPDAVGAVGDLPARFEDAPPNLTLVTVRARPPYGCTPLLANA